MPARPQTRAVTAPPLQSFPPCAGLSLLTAPRSVGLLKDQRMKKICLSVLALAGVCLMSSAAGATLTEDFSSNPFLHGWKVAGDTNLFRWNAADQSLSVTWDSAQGNTYFYHPLGTVLARDSDFALAFDLRLDQIGAGPDTNKATSFPISASSTALSPAGVISPVARRVRASFTGALRSRLPTWSARNGGLVRCIVFSLHGPLPARDPIEQHKSRGPPLDRTEQCCGVCLPTSLFGRIGIMLPRLDELPAVPAHDGATSPLTTDVISGPLYGTKEFPVAGGCVGAMLFRVGALIGVALAEIAEIAGTEVPVP